MSDDKMVLVSQQTIQPTTPNELWRLAESANKSGFLGTNSPDQALLVMMAGRDLGFSYTQSLRAFHVIKGKPSLSADAAVAVCTSRKDLCEYFRCIEMTTTSVTWETKRLDHPEPMRQTFTIEEATAAGLTSGNGDMYRKWPKRMLSSRCKMFLARDTYPELLMGLLDTDEAQSIEPREMPVPKVKVVRQERQVPPSKPPAVPDAVEEPDDDGTIVDALIARINDADLDGLKAIAKEIPQVDLTDGQLAAVRGVWTLRRDTLNAEGA